MHGSQFTRILLTIVESSHNYSDMQEFESVQKSFTARIRGMKFIIGMVCNNLLSYHYSIERDTSLSIRGKCYMVSQQTTLTFNLYHALVSEI